MLQLRPAGERGHFDHGWLDTYHSFSFADYHDPAHMGFRALRVINEDRVVPGEGFGTHPHRDMEIVTYVLEGALQHKDSMGTGSVIRPHEVQRMSAGTGVFHSEFNASKTDPVHLLQIWLLPERRGIEPSYEQKAFDPAEKRGRWRLVGARDGREGAVTIHQDVDLYGTIVGPGDAVRHALKPGRHAWVQVARGRATVNGQALEPGDGLALSDVASVEASGRDGEAELLLCDLA
jgi:redox-sensitive bicupin YhaK (pirin superfamily)